CRLCCKSILEVFHTSDGRKMIPPRSDREFGSCRDPPRPELRFYQTSYLSDVGATFATKSANNDPEQVQQRVGSELRYSTTSSARASRDGGTARPSTLAVFRLILSSNLVGCKTGSSAGWAPLRILPA